ncbi:lamin B receptor isoform X2 [Nomia melanderi]|uniref:lamin B receptor isoform X2 n=1 Tax=Nomia melanderi TaxID=2448451 RepID=UPI0013043866|nr:delta(14)-sterol reductase TM7SF2 isoform X2 [Nomia melanderi]
MKFSEGDTVLAKYPSTSDYQKGKILSARGDQYRVQFEAGIEYIVHSTDIKANRRSRSAVRSPSRGRRSSTRNSASRRSPSKRSPKRSPSKYSPGRSPSAKRTSTRDIPGTKNLSNTKSTIKDENFIESMPLQSRLKELGTITRRSTRLLSATIKPASDYKMELLTRSINRAVSLPIERKKQLHDLNIDGKERGLSVQRDQDLLKITNYEKEAEQDLQAIEKRKMEINMLNEPQEWGGWFGTLVLIFLAPLLIILPQLMCTQKQCKFDYPKIPKDLNSYINLKAFGTYLGFFSFVTLVSVIPIGRKVDGLQNRIGRLQYRLNGFLCAILSLLVFIVCVYTELGVTDLIINNYIQFSISGWLIGVILSILLFVKGGKAPVPNLNIQGSTNSRIYNFWQGREINPRIGSADIKICIFRSAMIAMMLINLTIVIKSIEEAESYSIEHLHISVLLIASLQVIYAMDSLFFESTILTTFEVMYEGTGYMLCTGYMLYPFLPTLITKYALVNKIKFSYLCGCPVFFFVVGYLLYRISNSQKHEFRKNPLSPAVAHLDTISTIRGKKLIVSGLWGHVRHPNYLGDIIMWWSISCVTLACDILPYYYAIMCTGLLVHRAIRDNERCKMRYGLAWEQYMSRVKYMILYRIF